MTETKNLFTAEIRGKLDLLFALRRASDEAAQKVGHRHTGLEREVEIIEWLLEELFERISPQK